MYVKEFFPRVAVPRNDVHDLFDPDRDVGRRLRGLLTKVLRGGREVLAVIGGYGLGKTHTLKYLNHIASSANVKIVYIPSPGRGFLDFYATVVENVLDTAVLKVSSISNPALKKALTLLRDEDSDLQVYVKGWLLGYSIPSNIKYKLGLIGNVRENNAVTFLSEILSNIVSNQMRVLILLDEVEVLLNLPRNARFSYMENLREFIDVMPEGTAVVMSMTPACWDDVMTLNPALYRRLSGNILYLKPLRREQVVEFVKYYFDDMYKLLNDDIYGYIYELTNGVHGEVLKYVSILLEETLQENGGGTLNLETAKRILAEYT
ncbi:MAG: DUF2791 family P-loop domain-containing protein [Thermosphaera sp.]